MKLAQECHGRSDMMYSYDDACGSNFLYMPSEGAREDASTATRWKYRFAMQCNLFPGHLLRLSLLPPCLIKGCNFGCTAFFSSLVRLAALGRLSEHVVRQTDSGSDNDAKATHAFHWSLIHFGVVQMLTWTRLPPKHSHNFADRVNSMVKEQIAPQRGSGGGCRAPFEFKDVMDRALKTLVEKGQGMAEFAWHFTNFKWVEWFASFGCIHKSFGNFDDHRHWVYQYDAALPEHGYVRVLYKEDIATTGGTTERPYEFKPVDDHDVTKPEGLYFIQDSQKVPRCLASPHLSVMTDPLSCAVFVLVKS